VAHPPAPAEAGELARNKRARARSFFAAVLAGGLELPWRVSEARPNRRAVEAFAAARVAAGMAPECFRVLQPGEVWNL
jgi:hypothetical protein